MKDSSEMIQQVKEIVFPVNYHNNPERKPNTTSDSGTLFESREYDLISAAVLIPLVLRENDWKLVMTKRSKNLKKHGGQISFPGGKYDVIDESLFNTALRETFIDASNQFNTIENNCRRRGLITDISTVRVTCPPVENNCRPYLYH